MKVFVSRLLLKLFGWRVDRRVPPEVYRKCVLVAAPHTSNWDGWFSLLAMTSLQVRFKFLIKQELLRVPVLGALLRALGAIGVDRSPRKAEQSRLSLTEAVVELYRTHDNLCVMIAPEGTRSLRKHWKTGFYQIAKQANVPIVLAYLDYRKKAAGIGMALYPTDFEADMRKIMAFYANITARHPELYSPDVDFV
jgi:1-acyl-sn-glycerol-3-phosphate acyltransferase